MGLAPGRDALPRDFIEGFQRERVALAVCELAHEQGLGAVTVSTITQRAKMARNTFYELFANREAAFDHANDLGIRKLRAAVRAAAAQPGPWRARIEAIIAGLLDAVSRDPVLAEFCLIHGRGAKSAAVPYATDLVDPIAGVLRPGRHEGNRPGPGPRAEELLAYGILVMIAEHLRRGEIESPGDLSRELTELATRPFLAAAGGLSRSPASAPRSKL